MAVSARFTLYHHRTVPPFLSIPIEYEAGWTPEQVVSIGFSSLKQQVLVDCIWNVMAHAQKQDFLFWRNRWVHLNRRGRQFSRLLAAVVCASAVVMLATSCSEVVWRVLATYSIRQFPLHFPPGRTSSCAITFQLNSTLPNLEWLIVQLTAHLMCCVHG